MIKRAEIESAITVCKHESFDDFGERVGEMLEQLLARSDDRDRLAARLARVEEAAEDTIAIECIGLEEDGGTCRTQDGWRDHPSKWCHVCTMARALEDPE